MLTIALTSLAAVYLSTGLLILARNKAGYSHLIHTISEIGAPNLRFVALAVFLPIGLLLFVVACLVQPASGTSAALALCIAIGYLAAAAFPCDLGSPRSGSTRQPIHNLGSAVECIGGGVALMRISQSPGQPLKLQRLAELCLFGELVLSLWLK